MILLRKNTNERFPLTHTGQDRPYFYNSAPLLSPNLYKNCSFEEKPFVFVNGKQITLLELTSWDYQSLDDSDFHSKTNTRRNFRQ